MKKTMLAVCAALLLAAAVGGGAAEALEYMEKLRNEGLRSIPLYASDGVTVLGWFR